MKNLIYILLLSTLSVNAFAMKCKNEGQLHQLDKAYEKAILDSDVETLQELLDEKYIWVHNKVSMIESKSDLINRVSDKSYIPPLSRKPSYQRTSRRNSTWVLMGVTEVNHIKPTETNPNNIRVNRFFFSKTYVSSGRKCRLISSMTMKMEAIDISADS